MRDIYDNVAGLRVTIDTDGLEAFEAVCAHDEPLVRSRLLDAEGVEEALVVRTCQRYEVYAYGAAASGELARISEILGTEHRAVAVETGRPVVEHLCRVACGLESGVLGEDEILGQLRSAYKQASQSDALGGTLDTIVLKALRVGERARTETAISEGLVSLGSVTVERVSQELKAGPTDCLEPDVLVVGAGEVAELVVKAFGHREGHGSVRIANRTLQHARELADDIGGSALALDELDAAHLQSADVLISATGADRRLFTVEDLDGHVLLVIDLANPRDVAPDVESLEDVTLVSIDDVLETRNEGLGRREDAVPAVEAIIEEELERLAEQLRAECVDDALNRIYSRSHELREAEFEHALERLDRQGDPLNERQRDVMRDFSEALITKLLHPKTTALRQAAAEGDRETLDAWLTLFEQGGTDLVEDAESKPSQSVNQ